MTILQSLLSALLSFATRNTKGAGSSLLLTTSLGISCYFETYRSSNTYISGETTSEIFSSDPPMEQNVELFAHYKEMNSNIEFIAVFNLDENPNIYQIHCFKDGNNAKNYDQNQQLSSYQFDKCFICGIDDKSCSSHDLQKQPSSSDCDDELCSSCESQKKFSSSDLDDKPCSSHDLQQQLSSSDLDDKPCSSHDLQKQLSSSDLDDKPSASRDFQKQLSSSDLDDKPCSSSNLQKPHPGHTDDESCCSNFVINQMRDPPKRSIPTKLIYGLRAECVASKSMEIADENAIVKRINWLIHQEEILMKNKESDSTLESMNLRPSMGFNPGDYANESYDDDFQKALQLSILDAIDRQKQNDLSDFSD
ncbi:unnamed protein product [Thelazia callipaeda]|uniref:Product n=1 Tax=Thelazia callipaeda TaxID=103827 RepID=A0A0N5D1M2_THECL|nr:unnamed protein product [Thelazia callipaeda]